MSKLEVSFKRGRLAVLMEECQIREAQHPIEGLMEVVRSAGTMVRVLNGLVGELDVQPNWEFMVTPGGDRVWNPKSITGFDHSGDQAVNALLKMYGEWVDRYGRACKMALDAGIAERTVQIAEGQAATLASALRGILADLDLTAEQAGRAPEIVRKHLTAIPATAGTVPAISHVATTRDTEEVQWD